MNHLRNHKIFSFAIAWTTLTFLSCNRIIDCTHEADETAGITVSTSNISEICLAPENHIGENYKVDQIGSYAGIKTIAILENSSCDTAGFPVIDFDQFSLIAQFAEGEGDGTTFLREVTMDTVAMTYTYTVTVRVCGRSKVFVNSLNWILVPKIPSGYTVLYEKITE